MIGQDDPPEKSAARVTAKKVMSWIETAVGVVAAVESWGGLAFVVLFALAAIVAGIIAAIPLVKAWLG